MNSILSKTIKLNKSDKKKSWSAKDCFFLLVSIPAVLTDFLPELLPHFSSEDITVHSIQTKDIETNLSMQIKDTTAAPASIQYQPSKNPHHC